MAQPWEQWAKQPEHEGTLAHRARGELGEMESPKGLVEVCEARCASPAHGCRGPGPWMLDYTNYRFNEDQFDASVLASEHGTLKKGRAPTSSTGVRLTAR
jgi:hypothetical protein